MTKTRVFLIDDHGVVRQGLRLLIDSQPDMEVVGEAENGEIAVSEAGRLMPDMVIMDVSMPVLNGLKATRRLRNQFPAIMILALTRHSDDGYLQQLLGAGANGYVLKQSAPKELINAIRAVGSGQAYLDPALTQRVMGGYVVRSTSMRGEGKKELSNREIEILKLISFGHSNKEIANRLALSVKTVEAHKANAMRKLGITGRIDIVKYAILQNWLEDT